MSSMLKFVKLFETSAMKKPNTFAKSKTYELISRSYADTTKADSSSKQVVVRRNVIHKCY